MAELMVGGAFLSSFLNVLFDRLASRQVVDFFREKKLDENRLRKSLRAVSVVLDDAETKQVTHPAVKEWLEELKDVTYHAEDVLDEIVTLASIPEKSLFSTDVKRVEAIVLEMESLVSEKEFLGLHGRVGDHNLVPGARITTSFGDPSMYGRDDDKQQMVESLLMDVAVGDPIPVITIVGMGGIGKTTLAQKLYNDDKLDGYFRIKAWVCVAQELDVFGITKTVLEMILGCSSDITDLNLLQIKLKDQLTGNKILLVLDDVWSLDYEKWCTVRDFFTMNAASGSKIIVTTRDKSVASIVRTVPSDHSLVPLSDDDSWLLFTTHAFGQGRNGDDYRHLQVIGKQIVGKCKGLPLAIKLLGGVLRNKVDVEWKKVMKSEFWDLRQAGILPALRLSYHFLPTHLKPCFAYCSIFPQDYEFEKEKLVLLWMAEGFVIDKTDKSMEELGEEYFDELVSRSFFQKSSSFNRTCFVMHDLNHDLARDVSGKFCLALERSKTCQLSETVRHFSYSKGKHDDYSKFEPILDAKYLRTFLPVRKQYNNTVCLPKEIIHDLLPKMSCIRVLSLSSYKSIDELPDSICTLIHLRYFDISDTAVQCLPNKICQLYNLQTLLLTNCRRLIKLPTKLGELVNLRHLNIRGTLIDKLPPQIRKLDSLQTLSRFDVGEGDCSGLGELNGLRQLKGSLSITGLHNVYNVDDAIEANLKEKMGIEQLWFKWGQGIEVSNNHSIILDNLQPSAELKRLTLVNYGGTRLSKWFGDASLINLKYLKISNCLHCLSLPSLGQLPSLLELHFKSMVSVRRVDSDFYGNGTSLVKPFQKLRILKFESMSEWEEWSSSRGVDNDGFPKLEELWIEKCPNLCGNLPKLLPSLRDLYIQGCSELTIRIPQDSSPRSLKLKGCKNVAFEDMSSLHFLRSLEMEGLQSNSFPSGMTENCLNLEELMISYWSSLTNLPDEGLPTTLRKLKISSCNNLLELLPKETFHNYKYLERLELNDSCDSLTSFPLGLFPNLKHLVISNCKNFKSFSIEDEDHENLKSLQYLRIEECDQLINFPNGGLRTANLNSLSIDGCKNLKLLPEEMNTQLTSLEVLNIWNCEEVEYSGGLPSNLRSLSVKGCKKLMAKMREWDLHTLSSLTDLSILNCSEIETIDGSRLPPNLKSLRLWNCNSKMREWDLHTLSSLTELSIIGCSEIETIDGSRLPPNLKSLRLWNCNSKMREWDVHTLSSLTELSIIGCSEIETIDGSRLPPNLKNLGLCNCNSKIREWDLHTLSSLHDLSIEYCSEIETIDGSRLPPNLRTLDIQNCPKVKFNSNLRNTQDLPASLTLIRIENCPLMEKQVETMNRDLFPQLTRVVNELRAGFFP